MKLFREWVKSVLQLYQLVRSLRFLLTRPINAVAVYPSRGLESPLGTCRLDLRSGIQASALGNQKVLNLSVAAVHLPFRMGWL
jgi:hypothetical protein